MAFKRLMSARKAKKVARKSEPYQDTYKDLEEYITEQIDYNANNGETSLILYVGNRKDTDLFQMTKKLKSKGYRVKHQKQTIFHPEPKLIIEWDKKK